MAWARLGRPSDAGKGKNAREMAELTNAIQKFFIENSRLGIPVMFHEECLHGHAGIGSTSFPQPIGLAATFNPDLVEALYTMTAEETRACAERTRRSRRWWMWRGTRAGAGSRKPSAKTLTWWRNLGMAAVRGFQGDAPFKDKKRVIATLKHFAAHGQPESGINCAPANVSMRAAARNVFVSVQGGHPEGRAPSA